MAAKKAKKKAKLKGQALTAWRKAKKIFKKGGIEPTLTTGAMFLTMRVARDHRREVENLCDEIAKMLPKNRVIRGTSTVKVFFNTVGRPASKPRGGVVKKIKPRQWIYARGLA